MSGSPTFQMVVSLSGLSSMFAEHAMRRAVVRAHVAPQTMKLSDIPLVLPEIARAIKPFLTGPEVEHAIENIRNASLLFDH